MKNKTVILLSVILVMVAIFFAPSCKKEEPGKAIITVVDSLNLPVFGAVVNLNSDNNPKPGIVKDKKTTDNNGRTYHEFPLEVILQVTKDAMIFPKSNIHIIPGETAELTVKYR
jgi:hypothetical protein